MAANSRSKRRDEIFKGPRTVVIEKTETGFGFNVRGQVSEGGQLKSINGVLYAPLQHVSAILEGGSAEKAGVKPGDRILEVNGENVEGATHRQVVDLIKAGGDTLRLSVISVPARDAQRLDPDDDYFYDYTDQRTIDLSIPQLEHVEDGGNKYVAYHIHFKSNLVVKRRYSEFLHLYEELMKIFTDFEYPKFPGKWPFQMSEVQLEKRRYLLETFIQKTFKVRVIQECELVQDFLNLNSVEYDSDKEEQPETHAYNADEELGRDAPPSYKEASNANKQQNGLAETTPELVKESSNEIRVSLPNQTSEIIGLQEENLSAESCVQNLCEKMNLSLSLHSVFCLCVRREKNFYCRLRPHESPAKYASLALTNRKRSDFAIRKWVFNPEKERKLLGEDADTRFLLFGQAIEDVKEGRITVGSRIASQLKMLASQNKHYEYLDLVSKSSSYGSVTFPHCACDSRKRGHVVVNISYPSFKLFACTEDGELESQVIEFAWAEMKEWQVQEKGEDVTGGFCFQYQRGEKKPRWVKVFTDYPEFMLDCFAQVLKEIEEEKSSEDKESTQSDEEENDEEKDMF
ncbi:sorting nexin-27-like [Clavelina lepadiformis]|uniref:sorting nexin-27-like n=1 Tax=Clavelina lepadiformis TaxID=159417 RepID=UPI004042A5F7